MCQIKDNETQKDCRYNSYTESSRVLQQRPIKGGSTSSLAAQPPQLLLLFAFVIRFCRLSLRSLSLSPPFPRMDRRSHNVRIYCCCCCWYVKGKIYMCTHVCVCVFDSYIYYFCCCHPAGHTYTHVHTRTPETHNSTICPLVFLSLLNTFHPISPDSCCLFRRRRYNCFCFCFCFWFWFFAFTCFTRLRLRCGRTLVVFGLPLQRKLQIKRRKKYNYNNYNNNDGSVKV